MDWIVPFLGAGAAILTIALWAAIARRERLRFNQLRDQVLEATRRLARSDFGHAIETREDAGLAEVTYSFDTLAASLRRRAQQSAALLDLDRALLRGLGAERVMEELLTAAAATLQSRSVSIVLLEEATPDRARCFDFLAGEGLSAPRQVGIDNQRLRHTSLGMQALDVNAVGVDSEEFLAPLTHCGARAFRICPLASRDQLAGFLCAGFRVDTHDSDGGGVEVSEIAERISLAIQAPAATGAVSAIAACSPLEIGLDQALQREEFTLEYQPIITARSGGVGAVEALVRWPQEGAGENRTAAEFIPVAEQSGLIVDLGDWVLRTACQQFDSWRREGIELDYISVNVSARQLRHSGLLPTVLACLQRSGMQGSQLQIEIGDEVLEDAPDSIAVLRELAHYGVRIALGEFGADSFLLEGLEELPLDTIKIARSCVAGTGEDAAARAVVQAAIGLGVATRRRVIAAGVERPEQLAFLEEAGCDAMQGFLIAAPMVAADLASFVRRQSRVERLVA